MGIYEIIIAIMGDVPGVDAMVVGTVLLMVVAFAALDILDTIRDIAFFFTKLM